MSHEIGHALGLPHNRDANSVMYGQFPSGTFFPSQADIDAVKNIYPICAPKVNNFSISLAPNPAPAKWYVTSPATSQCGPNGNRINPNGSWRTRLTIQAPSSGDIKLTEQVFKLFDANNNVTEITRGNLKTYKQDGSGDVLYPYWLYKKDTITSQDYFFLPNNKYVPTRAELTLSGTDDKGNPVQATASVNLEQGNYYLTDAHCHKKGPESDFFELLKIGGPYSCSGNCQDL